ncbi:cytochrome P450 4V2 [Ixodes scapularis]
MAQAPDVSQQNTGHFIQRRQNQTQAPPFTSLGNDGCFPLSGAMHPLGPYEVGELRSMATSVILWTGCLALLIHLLPKLFNWFRIYWHLRKLPSPSERFPFSFVLDMRNEMAAMEPGLTIPTKMYQYFKKKFYDYIEFDIMVCFFGPQPFVIPCSPDAIQPFLSHKENLNKSFLYDMMRPWLGNGLLTRMAASIVSRMINPLEWPSLIYTFSAEGKAFYKNVDFVKQYTRNVIKTRKQTYKAGLEDNFKRSSFMDIILRMHIEEGMFTEDEIREEVNTFMIGGFDTTAKAAAFAVHLLGNHPEVQAKVHKELDIVFGSDRERPVTDEDMKQLTYLECVIKVIKIRKQTYKAGLEDNFKRSSFMDIILRMHIEEGMFTEDEIREEVNTFMIGGFDTTATTAAFAVHLLGNHPEVQAKVHEELDIVFGSDRERPVTDEDMKQLTYLECVIKTFFFVFGALLEGHHRPDDSRADLGNLNVTV